MDHLKGKVLAEKYLGDQKDVANALKSGQIPDAQHHYENFGVKELRTPNNDVKDFEFRVDTCVLNKHGELLVNGWMNDHHIDIQSLDVQLGYSAVSIPEARLDRYDRPDVSRLHGKSFAEWSYGFWGVYNTKHFFHGAKQGHAVAVIGNRPVHQSISASIVTDLEFLEVFGGVVAHMRQPDKNLLNHTSSETIDICKSIWERALYGHKNHTEYVVGRTQKNPASTLITVIYGKDDLLTIQAALLWQNLPEDTEIIVVCNSPELLPSIHRKLKAAHLCYGVSVRLIAMAGNCGFGVANNVAVDAAKGEVVIFANPDLFPPAGNDWQKGWRDCCRLANEKNAVIGGYLYYGTGVMMHAGMDIIKEELVDPGSEGIHTLRVHHRGKGAPGDYRLYTKPTRVPAVTGGLQFVSKTVFESLNGFSSEYIFGHYEDADLCLRAWQKGYEVFLYPEVHMTHLESVGSRGNGFSRGISAMNRRTFTKKWTDQLDALEHLWSLEA